MLKSSPRSHLCGIFRLSYWCRSTQKAHTFTVDDHKVELYWCMYWWAVMLCLPRETEGPCQEGLGEEWHRGKSCQSTAQEKCQDKVTAPTVCIDQHKLSTKQASERLGKSDFLSPSWIKLNVSVQPNALFAAVLLETPSDFLKTQPNTQQSFLEERVFWGGLGLGDLLWALLAIKEPECRA